LEYNSEISREWEWGRGNGKGTGKKKGDGEKERGRKYQTRDKTNGKMQGQLVKQISYVPSLQSLYSFVFGLPPNFNFSLFPLSFPSECPTGLHSGTDWNVQRDE
jgi:hypothetical protein